MNRIGIACYDTKHVRTLHEKQLFVSPVGEQNCIHGMVHGAGRTEDSKANSSIKQLKVVFLLSKGSIKAEKLI